MTFFFHKLLSHKQEQEFNQACDQNTLRIQHKQKMLISMLLILFAVQKGIERNWSSFAFNTFGIIFILISCRYVKKTSIYYKYLLMVIVQIFNFFYPFNRFMKIPPNQDTYLDGNFICLGTLATLNSFSIKVRYFMLVPIFAFNLAVGPHNVEPQWSQFFKFAIMILMDLQYQFQQEILNRKNFQTLHNNIFIQNIFQAQDIFEIFQTQFSSEQQAIQLVSHKQRISEFAQFEFRQKLRKIFVQPKGDFKTRSPNQSKHFNSQLTLESFLYQFLEKRSKDAVLLEYLKNHSQYAELVGRQDKKFQQIIVSRIHHHQFHQSVVIIKELQTQTKIKQAQLKLENQKLILKQLFSIMNSSFKKSLYHLKMILQQNLNQLSIKQQLLSHNSHLTKAWNSYKNMIDFIKLSTKTNPMTTFDLLIILDGIIQIIQYLDEERQVDIKIINKLSSNLIVQDEAKIKQLFLNLFIYIIDQMEDNYNKIYLILEQDLQDRIIDVRLQYHSDKVMTRKQLKHLPILNPNNIKDLKHNSKVEMNLEIPISLWLIRILGPSNKIYLRKYKNQFTLEFQLYKVLKQEMQLSPVYHQKSDNIILMSETQQLMTHGFSTQQFILKE